MLAESSGIDVLDALSFGVAALVTLVGIVTGYATLRADVRRDQARIDALESKAIGLATDIDDLREWRAFVKGQQAGKRHRAQDSIETQEFRR